jgi:hypothetical protein
VGNVRIVTGDHDSPVKVVTSEGIDLSKLMALKDIQVYIDGNGVHATLGVMAVVDLTAEGVDYQVLDPKTGDWKQVERIVYSDGTSYDFANLRPEIEAAE